MRASPSGHRPTSLCLGLCVVLGAPGSARRLRPGPLRGCGLIPQGCATAPASVGAQKAPFLERVDSELPRSQAKRTPVSPQLGCWCVSQRPKCHQKTERAAPAGRGPGQPHPASAMAAVLDGPRLSPVGTENPPSRDPGSADNPQGLLLPSPQPVPGSRSPADARPATPPCTPYPAPP